MHVLEGPLSLSILPGWKIASFVDILVKALHLVYEA